MEMTVTLMKPTTTYSLLMAGLAGLVFTSQAHAAHHRHHHHKALSSGAEPHSPAPHHTAPDGAKHHKHHQRPHAATKTVATTAAAGAAAVVAHQTDTAAAAEPQQAAPDSSQPSSDKGSNTGLPIPRFAALRADKVYLRRGPGDRYPIDWVYHRRGLPVEIEREFDVWRLVEDSDGVKGWVHQATLFGSRTFVIPGLSAQGNTAQPNEASEREGDHVGRADARVLGYVTNQNDARLQKDGALLMSRADDDSDVVAVLKPGTVGNIRTCPTATQWCHVVVKGYAGWLPRRSLWGLLPGETIQSN
nr:MULTISPECIES: SH3 domain-containing protein [Neokomagataea]